MNHHETATSHNNSIAKHGNVRSSGDGNAVARASAFLVYYNAIEASLLEAVRAIRNDAVSTGSRFEDLTDWWRQDILKFHISDVVEQGCKNDTLYDRIDIFRRSTSLLAEYVNGNETLPFPGNINQSRIISWCRGIGVNATPPRFAKGGVDLDLIWRHRNYLAHGKESFIDIGNLYTVRDLTVMFFRVRAFMKAILIGVDDYIDRRGYLA